MLDCRWIAIVPAVLLAPFPTAGTVAQQRVSIHMSIGGNDITADLQPRAVIERRRDGDEVRVTLHGIPALEYLTRISYGDPLDVIATGPDGTSARMFNGVVSRISQGSRDTIIEITALAAAELATGGTPVTLDADANGTLLGFAPRLSSTSSVQVLVVEAVDAAGAPIVARAVAPTIAIGDASAEPFGRTVTVQADQVFATQSDADAFAFRTLVDRLADRVSGEAVIEGAPDLRIGSFVEIEGLDTEFDAPYYVTGVSHRIGSDAYGGFSTTLRVRRTDLGMFRLPEIDDEVLVAFDHGDVNQPYIVDSWWNCDGRPPSGDGRSDQCRVLRWPW